MARWQCCMVECVDCLQLYARCSSMNKHKRNLAVTGGVISSILLSPVLAALSVGKLTLPFWSTFAFCSAKEASYLVCSLC